MAAHGVDDGAEEIGLAALSGCDSLDRERGAQYADFVFGWLSEAARIALEERMAQLGYEYQSEFAKSYFARGREEGRDEGLDEGREEGLMAGIEALCDVLDIDLSPERRELLEQSSIAELRGVLAALRAERRWPA